MFRDYELTATLAGDAHFVLHRGRRTRTGAAVLIKLPRVLPPRSADAAALRRECALALELPGAAILLPRIVELESGSALVMEDPGGMPLSALHGAGPAGAATALAVGEQLAEALDALHRRGLVHRGLRPEAVLFDPAAAAAWLIDLGDACAASACAAPGAGPVLDRTRLLYAAPEQSGRVDHGVDARSDLYALGVLLYELLCGTPPFAADDALELIHRHIAATPAAPCALDPGIPQPLSAIVMRLLAKAPDERYQSARGLAADLQLCARAWRERRHIDEFPLGRHDARGKLTMPSRLYGRDAAVARLAAAFERCGVARYGPGQLLLVEGYAGVGKTALIQQLVRPIVRQRGYFVSGKFDQVARGMPFGALIQAFGALVQQLLTESEAQLAVWREALATALGANGGVLAEVIPEIEFIVGPQAVPVALGSAEAQNRFQRVLQNFVAAIARPQHPLVIFLDDLQWADAATLTMLEPLLAGGESPSLLLIGAVRDNELDAAPRLARALAALTAAGVELQRITLGPLQADELVELVADTLHCSPEAAAPLARLIGQKTGGNPFFVTQFLQALERDGQLRFDVASGRWQFRMEEIAAAPLADNVIELMTRRIQGLPAKAQYALTLAACIGNRFDAPTLSIVSEQTAAQTATDLKQALDAGLIVAAALRGTAPDEVSSYAFLHDRVQQAAYALIPEERRRMVHLTVGRLLRARRSPEGPEAHGFDVVQHLNQGRELITRRDERLEVARLNLEAGRKAKSSTAHDTALELFEAGIQLLDETAWQQDYALCFALHLEAAESRTLCGQFDAALAHTAALLPRAASALDRARVIRLRSLQYENLACYADAIATTCEALALFGLSFPATQTDKIDALEREIETIASLRGDRDIAALAALPPMSDPPTQMVAVMLTDIWSAAYLNGDATLARLISATLVRLSLQHGNAPESAYGYVTHAISVGADRGDPAQAFAYGCLALEVNRRFDDLRRRAKILQQFHAHVNFWCRPVETCARYAREACQVGMDSGDFLYAAYGAGTQPWAAMLVTRDLAEFEREHTTNIALIERLKNPGFADSVRLLVHWARALQGRTAAPLSLTDADFDEAQYRSAYGDSPFFATIHAIARLPLCTLLGGADDALAAAHEARGCVHHLPGTVWPLIFDLWHALALAAHHHVLPPDECDAALASLRAAQSRFATLSVHCAENYQCPAGLIGAEIARLEARTAEAIAQFESVIEYAAAQRQPMFEALAHELCGRCLLGAGRAALARMHLTQARLAYARWGAQAKVDAMRWQYPLLALGTEEHRADAGPLAAGEPLDTAAPNAARATTDGFDLYSVSKAAQAIAAEVELEGLLVRLMRIAIENAGAERGALVLESDAGPMVHAMDGIDTAVAGAPTALEQSLEVPVGLVNYVRRTAEPVFVSDSKDGEEPHAADPYVARVRPRSLMCLPALKQGRLVGVLYLENRRVHGAFTARHARVLQMLAAQAAISLENARLFAEQRREIAERELAQASLASALSEVERLRQDLEAENSYLRRDLVANVSHDLRTPLVSIRGYLELLALRGDTLDAARRKSCVDTALRQSEHLGTLIDELFELAKLDFKGINLQLEIFALAELAGDVAQKFQLVAEGRQIGLRLDVAPNLPPVQADLSLIERVFDNLIGNALKHTPSGGSVRIELRDAGERGVGVRVRDSGPGIAAAELPHIFDRFYRAATAPRCDPAGAGLGLAIARRIVELHGAVIGVESSSQGSCFHFAVPAAGTTAAIRESRA